MNGSWDTHLAHKQVARGIAGLVLMALCTACSVSSNSSSAALPHATPLPSVESSAIQIGEIKIFATVRQSNRLPKGQVECLVQMINFNDRIEQLSDLYLSETDQVLCNGIPLQNRKIRLADSSIGQPEASAGLVNAAADRHYKISFIRNGQTHDLEVTMPDSTQLKNARLLDTVVGSKSALRIDWTQDHKIFIQNPYITRSIVALKHSDHSLLAHVDPKRDAITEFQLDSDFTLDQVWPSEFDVIFQLQTWGAAGPAMGGFENASIKASNEIETTIKVKGSK